MTEAIWVALITQSGVIGAAVVGMWRKLGRIDQQTTNSHTGSPYPNLRDEITAVRSTVEATAQTVLSHGRHLERIDRNILDLHAVTDATDTALDRTRTTTLRAQAREAAERENALRELEHRLRADIRAALAEAWQNSPAMKGPTP